MTRLVHVAPHPGKALEITVDVVARGGVVDTQGFGQTKGAHAINQAEVDHLGIAALLTADLIRPQAKHLSRRGAVHIQPLMKGTQQGLVFAQMRHDAQLNLAVVGARNAPAFGCHEGLSHPSSLGGADRDILQIRVVAGQATRHRDGLSVMRVHASGAGMRHPRQFVGVGAFEFGESPVLQDLGGQGVVLRQFFQHFFVRARCSSRCFFYHRQAELLEENFSNLLGRTQVERFAGNLLGFLLEFQDALPQGHALGGQSRAINQHSVALNTVQRLGAGDFQLIHRAQTIIGLQARPQHAVHIQCHVSVFTGVLRGARHIDLAERNLVRALATQVLVTQAAAAHMTLGQAGQPMGTMHLQHIALQHGVVHIATHLDAVVGQHVAVVLDVLPQLVGVRVFQPGTQALEHLAQRQLLWGIRTGMGQRNVGRLAGLHRQRDAHNLRLHLIERSGLGVECRQRRRTDALQPAVECGPIKHRGVVAPLGL